MTASNGIRWWSFAASSMSGSPFESTTILKRALRRASAAGTSGNGRSVSICATRWRTSSIVNGMPARSSTQATDRWPISRYDVCSRWSSASIIEFSKCVRRHHVTNACGSPGQPFCRRYGADASVSPPCMSTTVPYWSNMHTLMVAASSAGLVTVRVSDRVRPLPGHDAAVLRNEAAPGRRRSLLRGVDQGAAVDVHEPAVFDDDAAVDEHGLHVL